MVPAATAANARAQRLARELDRAPKTRRKPSPRGGGGGGGGAGGGATAGVTRRTPSVLSVCVDSVSWAAAALHWPSLFRRLLRMQGAGASSQ